MRHFRRRPAFSLLELLAVVVILGIIAAIVVPRVSSSASTAKTNVSAHTKDALNTAIEKYYVELGTWPATLTDLVPTYLPDGVPVDPVDGSAYVYSSSTHRVSGP